MSRYYLAFVDAAQTVFTAEFAREDVHMQSFQCSQVEADFCSLSVVIENPGVALLDPSREQWAWLSMESGSDFTPLFFGRIVGVPADQEALFVTVQFIAKPVNFEAAKQAVAAGLRVAPFWDYAFIDPQMWEDADATLEARTDAWHIDRLTGEVTVSSLIQGEDGTLDITADLIPFDGFSLSFRDAPLRKVRLEMRAMWTQELRGSLDITADLLAAFKAAGSPTGFVTSYTGAGLHDDWPEDGDNIGNVYAFGPQDIRVADGGALKNKVKSVSVKYDSAPSSTEKLVQVRPMKADFRRWGFRISSLVNYDISIDRTEDISFAVYADVQNVVNDEEDEQSEVITLSSGTIGTSTGPDSAAEIPIGDVKRDQFFTLERGHAAVEFGLSHARAMLLRRARAAEIKVRVPFATAIQATCRKSATIHHPELPGGSATGKIVGYTFGVDGSTGVELGEITIACLVGRNTTLEAVTGTPTYAEADALGPDVQVFDGARILSSDINMTYDQPACDPLSPVRPSLLSVTVANGETAQEALLSRSFIDVAAAADALNAICTTVDLKMTPIDTSPRETRYHDSSVTLSIPKGIDLGEAA